MEVEVMPPDQQRYEQPGVRLTHVRALGIFGTLLAILTMFAAVGVGFVAFFATSLVSAGLVALTWPLIFSVEFTHWVFGAARPPFWKLFLLFMVAGTVTKLFGLRRSNGKEG